MKVSNFIAEAKEYFINYIDLTSNNRTYCSKNTIPIIFLYYSYCIILSQILSCIPIKMLDCDFCSCFDCCPIVIDYTVNLQFSSNVFPFI